MFVTVASLAGALPIRRDDPTSLPSFRAVYDEYFDSVWTWARQLGVPPDAIDDVVQDVFIVVHNRLKTLERPASLRSWLYSVVRRTVSTYHRGQQARTTRQSPVPAEDDTASAMQPSPLDLALLSDELKLLWRLLAELDPAKREVLVLAEIEEMTIPEIAKALGIPLNTTYSRLRAARQDFDAACARYAAHQRGRP
jgi:RNA polymerase sigma-70 factor (ECF subfamily)